MSLTIEQDPIPRVTRLVHVESGDMSWISEDRVTSFVNFVQLARGDMSWIPLQSSICSLARFENAERIDMSQIR